MATTDLKLDEPGLLPRPGPVGQIARLLFGMLCLWYVFGLVVAADNLITNDGHIRPLLWNGLLPGLVLISYVINIGYSLSWQKKPAILSAVVVAMAALAGYLSSGTFETELVARVLWAWELYIFAHLGLSFIIAAAIRTPGCEMRAFSDLYSRITGKPTKEHYCPIGPLHPIDQWEAGRSAHVTDRP